uniref:leucine-rich repeat-containing protein 15-like n=1 Tax=Ciona intestinalis TaxID=7719 RepID=UPI000180BA53|nr:leucine-rich repeat-containing protein 15-like [Ciona intestinalis]|eukprot:XP_002119342.1 leucine-rich repeat-containing protein 15-like [Ciona intestinalis]
MSFAKKKMSDLIIVAVLFLIVNTIGSEGCWSNEEIESLIGRGFENTECETFLNQDVTSLPASCARNSTTIRIVMCCMKVLITAELSYYKELTHLDLSYNFISSLPHGVFDYNKKLANLSIRGNNITNLNPRTFQGLKALKRIDLSGNSIKSLPQGTFDGCTQLQELNLSHNQISVFEGSFLSLKSLRLGHNRIIRFAVQTETLETLDLSSNQIQEWQNGEYRNLKSLALCNNSIKTVSQSTFHGMRNLVSLDLGDNVINELEEETFEKLCKLELLDLSGNKLTIPKRKWFTNVVRNNDIAATRPLLKGNEWECTVNSRPFKAFLNALKLDGDRCTWLERLRVDCVGTNKGFQLKDIEWGAPSSENENEETEPLDQECQVETIPLTKTCSILTFECIGFGVMVATVTIVCLLGVIWLWQCKRRKKYEKPEPIYDLPSDEYQLGSRVIREPGYCTIYTENNNRI